MRKYSKIWISIIIASILIQLWQPARNDNEQVLATDITKVITLPEKVQHLLKKSCYDCHSNKTEYPWYARVQPMAWFISRHIRGGKSKLNFSDFGSYTPRRQSNKLKTIASVIKKQEMPLASYLLLHPAARLSEAERKMLITWAERTALELDK